MHLNLSKPSASPVSINDQQASQQHQPFQEHRQHQSQKPYATPHSHTSGGEGLGSDRVIFHYAARACMRVRYSLYEYSISNNLYCIHEYEYYMNTQLAPYPCSMSTTKSAVSVRTHMNTFVFTSRMESPTRAGRNRRGPIFPSVQPTCDWTLPTTCASPW